LGAKKKHHIRGIRHAEVRRRKSPGRQGKTISKWVNTLETELKNGRGERKKYRPRMRISKKSAGQKKPSTGRAKSDGARRERQTGPLGGGGLTGKTLGTKGGGQQNSQKPRAPKRFLGPGEREGTIRGMLNVLGARPGWARELGARVLASRKILKLKGERIAGQPSH